MIPRNFNDSVNTADKSTEAVLSMAAAMMRKSISFDRQRQMQSRSESATNSISVEESGGGISSFGIQGKPTGKQKYFTATDCRQSRVNYKRETSKPGRSRTSAVSANLKLSTPTLPSLSSTFEEKNDPQQTTNSNSSLPLKQDPQINKLQQDLKRMHESLRTVKKQLSVEKEQNVARSNDVKKLIENIVQFIINRDYVWLYQQHCNDCFSENGERYKKDKGNSQLGCDPSVNGFKHCIMSALLDIRRLRHLVQAQQEVIDAHDGQLLQWRHNLDAEVIERGARVSQLEDALKQQQQEHKEALRQKEEIIRLQSKDYAARMIELRDVSTTRSHLQEEIDKLQYEVAVLKKERQDLMENKIDQVARIDELTKHLVKMCQPSYTVVSDSSLTPLDPAIPRQRISTEAEGGNGEGFVLVPLHLLLKGYSLLSVQTQKQIEQEYEKYQLTQNFSKETGEKDSKIPLNSHYKSPLRSWYTKMNS